MAVPVIDSTTSVLGFRKGEEWQYQPAATNSPNGWTCTGLPAGISINGGTGLISGAATAAGVFVCTLGASVTTSVGSFLEAAVDFGSDLITLNAHGLANTTKVRLTTTDTLPAPLVPGTTYFIVGSTTNTFQLAATSGGAAIDLTDDGTGTHTIHTYEPSADFILTIGIEAAEPDLAAAELLVETQSGEVFIPNVDGTWKRLWDAGKPVPALFVKRGDTVPILVRFSHGPSYLDLELTSLKLTVKQYEPEAVLLTVGGDDTEFVRRGAGDANMAGYLVVGEITGDAIDSALSEFEEDRGTFFYALAEIEWQADSDLAIGPATLVNTSRTFVIGIERDLTA